VVPDIPEFPEDSGRPPVVEPGIDLLRANLAIINRLIGYIIALLNDNRFFNYQIEDILSILENLFRFHEAYYGALTHFVNQFDMENNPLLDQFERLHQD
jgi:hypothetical protein